MQTPSDRAKKENSCRNYLLARQYFSIEHELQYSLALPMKLEDERDLTGASAELVAILQSGATSLDKSLHKQCRPKIPFRITGSGRS